MPNWKKVVVSGSDAALNSLNITTTLTASGDISSSADIFGRTGSFDYLDVAGNVNIGGDLIITGSLIYDASITTFTRRITAATASVLDSDYRLAVRYTDTGSVQLLLPKISDVGERDLRFKDEEGNAALNNITIIASGSDLIDGDTTAIMNRNYMAIGLYNDGVSNWYIE